MCLSQVLKVRLCGQEVGGMGTEGHSWVLGILRVGHSEHVVAVGECDTSETDLNLFTITLFPE